MGSKPVYRLGVLALVLVALSACSAVPDPDKLAQDEYSAMAAKYPLPNGVTYPALSLESGGEHVVYDKDAAALSALMKYQCAWEDEAVAGASSPSRLTGALTALKRLPDEPVWGRGMDDNGKKLLADQIAKAELGDVSSLASYVEVNCQ